MRKRTRSPGEPGGDQQSPRAIARKTQRKHAPVDRSASKGSRNQRSQRPGPSKAALSRGTASAQAARANASGSQHLKPVSGKRQKGQEGADYRSEYQNQPPPQAAKSVIPASPPATAVRIVSVDLERAGQRVDNFLMAQLKGVPKSLIYRVLRTGQVRVNGGRAKPETRLVGGDQVRIPPVRLPDKDAVAAPSENLAELLASRIVADEREFLVLNKPSGLASHGGSGISLGAIEALRSLRPEDSLELVHRLDRDTSGLLAFAKKHSALRKLQALIREGQVGKRYLALISGSPASDRFDVDAPLLKNQLQGGERMVEVDIEGKPSLSRFCVLERFGIATLVEVEIVTGRTHQIRVHALHAGHPLAGDEKYGDAEFNRLMKSRGLRRLFLHAHQLRFPWGERDEKVYSAPLDDDLRGVLQSLTNASRLMANTPI